MPRIWRWIESFKHKVADDYAPQTLDTFVAVMAAKWQRQKSWAVYGDSELGGLITFERLSPWLGTAHLVLKPDFQGRGVAVKACRLAVAAMFEQGVGKLAFYPLAGNLAIGSLLCNLGAKREGTLIAHTLCGGKPTDMWIYGLTKEGFEHAISSRDRTSISNHRGRISSGGGSVTGGSGSGVSGLVSGRPAEDQYRRADTLPGVAGSAKAVDGVLDQPAH